MNDQINFQLEAIRERWTDSERENRKRLAAAKQSELRQIVVLDGLTDARNQSDQQLEIANAC